MREIASSPQPWLRSASCLAKPTPLGSSLTQALTDAGDAIHGIA